MGWQCSQEEMAYCEYCGRKWSPYLVDERSNVEPIQQHQLWCAWRDDNTGWRTYLQQLRDFRDRERKGGENRLSAPLYVNERLYMLMR